MATDAQKAEAARLAKVAGVTKVDNEIKVDKDVDRTLGERAKSGLTKTGEAITDTWITAKVKWFFVGEDSLKGSDISVDTSNHVVTLKGTVHRRPEKHGPFSSPGKPMACRASTINWSVKAKPAKTKTTH